MEPHWFLTKDGDPVAFVLAKRHYSARKTPNPQIRLFVGPGEKLVLRTESGDAVWAWRKFIDDSGQKGVCCTIFRNEGEIKSSQLIREACRIAHAIWPSERCYSFIDPCAIRSKNPGACFKRAGWRTVRDVQGNPLKTKSNLLILEYFHEWEKPE